jgi:hypothetical protein
MNKAASHFEHACTRDAFTSHNSIRDLEERKGRNDAPAFFSCLEFRHQLT